MANFATNRKQKTLGCPAYTYYPVSEPKIKRFKKELTLAESKKTARVVYLYGFNGIEKADKISGAGNHYTALYGEYESRLGRRWNEDPKPNPSISSYAVFANNPIWYNDPLLDTLPITYSSLQTNYPTTGTPSQMYNSVGGQVAKAFNDAEAKDPTNNAYANTCALRMSVALNKSGNDVDTKVKNSQGKSMYTLKGGDKKDYALRKNDVKDYMKGKYGKADISTKSTDKDFDAQIAKIQGQKGVIVFDVTGWGNATGHVTIYDGSGNCGHDCYFKDAINSENSQRTAWNTANPTAKQLPMVELKGVSLWIAK
jgi:hypothetical protein